MHDDSTYLEQALQEYRERSWDDADFADLADEVQRAILHRAQQLKSSSEEERFAA